MQFHANFKQFSSNLDYFSHFWPEFQNEGYLKAYTQDEKFLGSIGKGHRPQEMAKSPKEEAKSLQMGPKAP